MARGLSLVYFKATYLASSSSASRSLFSKASRMAFWNASNFGLLGSSDSILGQKNSGRFLRKNEKRKRMLGLMKFFVWLATHRLDNIVNSVAERELLLSTSETGNEINERLRKLKKRPMSTLYLFIFHGYITIRLVWGSKWSCNAFFTKLLDNTIFFMNIFYLRFFPSFF